MDPDATLPAAAAGWRPVSPRLATARRLRLLGAMSGLAVALALAAGWLTTVGGPVWVWLALALPPLAAALSWPLIGRQVASWGYRERDEDLLVRSGILVHRLVVVPYGRMQLVDVTSGPIERWLGLATVQLHTAAATTDAVIPGLPAAEAAGLRDRLAAQGESRPAGM